MSGPQQSSVPLYEQYVIAFEGNALGYVLYGVYVAVAVTNLVLLYKKKSKILFAFTLIQLVVTTLYNAIQMYVSPQDFMSVFGSSSGSNTNVLSPWPNELINAAYVVNMWFSDAFLIYRCYVVLIGYRYGVAFPAVLYLGMVGSSIAYLKVCIDPSATYSTTTVQTTALCYWSFSVALNVVASTIIAVRFWYLRRQIFRASPQQGAFYLAYMAMTLESALLYTAFGIAGLVVLALNSPLESVFFTILGPIQVLAPALIVNRIARGVSIESDFDSLSVGTISTTIRYAAPQRQSLVRPTNVEFSQRAQESSDGSAKLGGRSNDGSTLYLYNDKSIV